MLEYSQYLTKGCYEQDDKLHIPTYQLNTSYNSLIEIDKIRTVYRPECPYRFVNLELGFITALISHCNENNVVFGFSLDRYSNKIISMTLLDIIGYSNYIPKILGGLVYHKDTPFDQVYENDYINPKKVIYLIDRKVYNYIVNVVSKGHPFRYEHFLHVLETLKKFGIGIYTANINNDYWFYPHLGEISSFVKHKNEHLVYKQYDQMIKDYEKREEIHEIFSSKEPVSFSISHYTDDIVFHESN